jgi:hypothetical protein
MWITVLTFVEATLDSEYFAPGSVLTARQEPFAQQSGTLAISDMRKPGEGLDHDEHAAG